MAMTRTWIALPVALALVAAGCSGSVDFSIGGQSPERAAEVLIEGELADQAGLGELDATCPDVADPDVGTEFVCTATTSDGQEIEFVTLIDREDHIDVNSTNVILGGRLPEFETAGAEALGRQFGVRLPPGTIDCGDAAIVLAGPLEFVCAFNDPDTADVYDITFELPDLNSGDFSVFVAEAPRG